MRGHALEPWAAYWTLKARLNEATEAEVQAFAALCGHLPGRPPAQRLAAAVGQRRDWAQFAAYHPQYRMQDDREVRCYALLIDQIKAPPRPVRGRRAAGLVCPARCRRRLHPCGQPVLCRWQARQARRVAQGPPGRGGQPPRAARNAVEIVAPESLDKLRELLDAPTKYLRGHSTARGGRVRQELVLLALIKLATSDVDAAAAQLDSKWGTSPEERNWAWGVMGKAARSGLARRPGYFANVTRDTDLNDDLLAWKVRAALRAGQWTVVRKAVDAMSEEARQDSTWVYWKARAPLAGRPRRPSARQAQQLLAEHCRNARLLRAAGAGRTGPARHAAPAPAPLTDGGKGRCQSQPGLNWALYAVMGLRSEGVREWNYTTNLHDNGGMSDRALLAAADFACQQQVWDRCINTSERTRSLIDMQQRFPMPFQSAVVERAQAIGLTRPTCTA